MDTEERLRSALANRYQIEREIGSGGMATVYLARDLKHNRQVAVKVLDPGLALALGAERFLLEIETVAHLTHPHILPLHDSGEADGFLFYVMPFVKGDSLHSRLKKENKLPVGDAIRIAREIAGALTYAHEEGVIHRDVKPANIMLEAGHAVLTDFGVAHAMARDDDERITGTGISLGTPAYMSPEQVVGDKDLDGRSDQYALACVLFEMLAGHPPFTGASGRSLLHHHLAMEPPSIEEVRPGVSRHVAAVLQRALSKAPSDRFATAMQFAEALAVEAPTPTMRPGPSKRQIIRRTVAALGGVLVLVAAGFSARHFVDIRSDPGPPPADRPYTVLATVGGNADSRLREDIEFLLRSALDVAHVVQTVPVPEVERVLTLMERSDTVTLDAATARELAERLGVSTIVDARLSALGNGYLLAARVEDVGTGHLVAESSGHAANVDLLTETVDAVALDLRRELGESRVVLANHQPLPQLTTSSIEALRKYREGLALHRNFQPAQAVPRFREALALDPEFSAAHVSLSGSYHNAGVSDSVVVHLRRALNTPDRLPDDYRRDTEAYLKYASDFGHWDESMFASGLRNSDALRLTDFQRFDSAWEIMVSEVRDVVARSRRFDPDGRLSTKDDNRWRNAIRLAIVTGRADEVEALRDSLRVDAGEYWELMRSFDSNDWNRADSVRSSAPDIWGTHVNKRMAVAALEAVRGRVVESYDRWASIHSRRVSSARARLIFQLVYGVPGPDTLLSLTDRGLDAVEKFAAYGVRSAIGGDTTEAKRVAARLAAARDSVTSDLFEGAFEPMFTLIEAGVVAQRGALRNATTLLESCVSRLAEQGYGFITDRLLVRWILAEMYAQQDLPDMSIRQLDALLAERTFEPLYVLMYAPAHFRLGQLYTEAGDTANALEHYRTFLDTFTDPDPQYEWMVEEARTGLARLGG